MKKVTNEYATVAQTMELIELIESLPEHLNDNIGSRIEDAVKAEDYEKAAELRDDLQQLRQMVMAVLTIAEAGEWEKADEMATNAVDFATDFQQRNPS